MAKGLYRVFRTKEENIAYDEKVRLIMKQNVLDLVHIVLHDAFGFGPERQLKFYKAFEDYWNSMCELGDEDVKSDKDFVYFRHVIDNKLEEACGKYFVPWDQRYLNCYLSGIKNSEVKKK